MTTHPSIAARVLNDIRCVQRSYAGVEVTNQTRRLDARLECLSDLLMELPEAPDTVCHAVHAMMMEVLEDYQGVDQEQGEEREEAKDHARHLRGMNSARIAAGLR